jgi:hypothetical protein
MPYIFRCYPIPQICDHTMVMVFVFCFWGVYFYFWIATYLVLLLVDFYFSCGYDVDHITPEWG